MTNWHSHVLEPFTTAVIVIAIALIVLIVMLVSTGGKSYLPIALFLWTVVLLAVSLVQLLVHMVIRMRRRRDAVIELG